MSAPRPRIDALAGEFGVDRSALLGVLAALAVNVDGCPALCRPPLGATTREVIIEAHLRQAARQLAAGWSIAACVAWACGPRRREKES